MVEKENFQLETENVAGVQSQTLLALEERLRVAEEGVRSGEASLENERIIKRNVETSFSDKYGQLLPAIMSLRSQMILG